MANRLLEITDQAAVCPVTGRLQMYNPRRDTFQITIQLTSGREFDMWVYEDTTIRALAKDIAMLEDMSIDDIRFGNELHWNDQGTGMVLSRLQWLWDPAAKGGWKGDWDLQLANLRNSSRVYVDWLAEDNELEEMVDDFEWVNMK